MQGTNGHFDYLGDLLSAFPSLDEIPDLLNPFRRKLGGSFLSRPSSRLGWHRDSCRAERKPSPATEAVPATDFIAAERKFTEVCIFARLLAELDAPPTMRHHAETSATMIADLGMPNHTFVHGSELRCVSRAERSA